MDRWSERDDDDGVQKGPQGRVAREGIGAFIKQDKGRAGQVTQLCAPLCAGHVNHDTKRKGSVSHGGFVLP